VEVARASFISKKGKVMNDEKVEEKVIEKGLTAPRVTKKDLEDNIVDTEICKFVSKSGQVLRWAVLNTKSGFAVVGKHSCAVSAENDDQEIGESIAVENAKERMWELMGYNLHQELYSKKIIDSKSK
jgi:hypothetical protein